jgi:hypothetical protein
MAASPQTGNHDDVLARLSELRGGLESLIASVASGEVSLDAVLQRSEHEMVCGFVYLVKIAEALPGVGKVRARRVLESQGFGERTRVSDVPPAARAALVGALS